MSIQEKRIVKIHIVMALELIGLVQRGMSDPHKKFLITTLFNSPLIVHTMSTQQARANTDFSFSLNPYSLPITAGSLGAATQ